MGSKFNIGGNVDKIISESTVHEGDHIIGEKAMASEGATITIHRDGSSTTDDVDTSVPLGPIFVSHAHADVEFLRALLDLLATSVELHDGELHATSLTRWAIPAGERWADYLRARLIDTRLVIILITPAYLASSSCMVELGALWVLDKPIVPLMLPPVGPADLQFLLADMQCLDARNGEHLEVLRDRVAASLDRPVKGDGGWREELHRFLEP